MTAVVVQGRKPLLGWGLTAKEAGRGEGAAFGGGGPSERSSEGRRRSSRGRGSQREKQGGEKEKQSGGFTAQKQQPGGPQREAGKGEAVFHIERSREGI